ncbi:hypothetical protein JTE90_002644 [Oedothorax gibbosus]|uniref:Integrase catalytic domain-containing protein n=1 Tax=Oedothorax gibbosus TaxID=931172 RepID=A0AAV6VG49_9ARAC|nr:hypothetical protein JTE90_002644 [Oedothorax gibbosus]
MVERFHRSLKQALMCHHTLRWTQALPLVLLGLRSAIKEDLGCTSSELVYGSTIRLPSEIISPSPTTQPLSLPTPHHLQILRLPNPQLCLNQFQSSHRFLQKHLIHHRSVQGTVSHFKQHALDAVYVSTPGHTKMEKSNVVGLSRSKSSQVTSQSKYQAKVASQQSQYVSSASSYGSQQPVYSASVTASGNTSPSQMGYSSLATASYSSNNTGYSNQPNVYSGSTNTTTQGYSSHATASYSSNNTGYSNQQNGCSLSTDTITQGSMLSSQAGAKQCLLPSDFIISPCQAPFPYSLLTTPAYVASVTTSGNTYPLQTDACFEESLESSEDSQDSFSAELQTIFIKKIAEEESVSAQRIKE